jgi:general secretion pathway protein I
MRSQGRRAQRGFSLLELLVAFSIMGLSLGILYRAAGSSARSVGDAEQYQAAVVLAESLMAVRESVPPAGWNEVGRSGSFSWSVRSAPFPTPVASASPFAVKLHEVAYTITWQDADRARQLDFVTLLPEGSLAAAAAARR